MSKPCKNLTDAKGEVAELSVARPQGIPAGERDFCPKSLRRKLGGFVAPSDLRPKSASLIRAIARCRSLEAFDATGEGWQTRVDAALRDWLKKHTPA